MKIDGRAIAQRTLNQLKQQISHDHLSPTLLVILVGENPASISYIKQKQKAAEFIGAKLVIRKLSNLVGNEKIIQTIGELNENPKVHGIIVQLPLPPHLNPDQILSYIEPRKDVDGFTPNSPFTPPVAMAVLKILDEVTHLGGGRLKRSGSHDSPEVDEIKKFLVIGRGTTAGKPIAKTLKKSGYKISIAHSKTGDLKGAIKKADVIISCVGKPEIIKAQMLKPGAIVIGVGIHRTADGRLAGDFNEEEISKVASFYTPMPGGIGPVNVACLMENLVRAAQNQVRPG